MPAAAEKAPFTVPQPNGEPIEFDNTYGAIDQFKAVIADVSHVDKDAVPAHLVAILTEAANSKDISNAELAAIAKDMHAADTLLRETGSQPIIYRLHCEDAFAVTPEEGTTGFRLIDKNTDPESSPYLQTAVDTAKVHSIWDDSSFSGRDDGVREGEPLTMHEPLSFLSSGNTEDVKRFLDHDAAWKRYPNSEVIVGHSAVSAFLEALAQRDLEAEGGGIDRHAVVTSWAMLASAGLKRVGYSSSIGKHGDIVHRASIEGLADVLASGLGYDSRIARGYTGEDAMFLRRLEGVEFDLRADAQMVGAKAAEYLFSDENRVKRFQGLLYGDKDRVEVYMTETAGNFMSNLLGAK